MGSALDKSLSSVIIPFVLRKNKTTNTTSQCYARVV